jgi:hypothetical protein
MRDNHVHAGRGELRACPTCTTDTARRISASAAAKLDNEMRQYTRRPIAATMEIVDGSPAQVQNNERLAQRRTLAQMRAALAAGK